MTERKIVPKEHKETWRNLTAEEYANLRTQAESKGMVSTLALNGLLSAQDTPLEKATKAFITECPKMAEVKRRAGILTVLNQPVLITGESGTGKELVARMLHGNRLGKLVAVNITSVVDTLFESELFGHVRGSFTGAVADRPGKIELASNGTLFLDEIGDMSLSLQAKLLRVIQEGVYQRVGSNEDSVASCRFVFATHCDLEKMVEEKKFRLDLYHRINTFKLHLAPLRERYKDVERIAVACGIAQENLEKFMAQVKERKMLGNCRELQTYILRFNLFGSVE